MTNANRYFSDVSSNNGSFNAAQYASAGHKVIGIKATEGEGYTNPFHGEWTEQAHMHGLAVWHYHFSLQESSTAEADRFLSAVTDFKRPGDRLFADCETGSPLAMRGWLAGFDAALDRNGYHLGCYCPLSFYTEGGLKVKSNEYWIAAWGNNRPSLRRGDTLLGWQYNGGNSLGGEIGPFGYAGIPGQPDGSILDVSLANKLAKRGRK